MAARHRWLFPEASPPKTATWFLWHRGFQLGGLLLFGAAFLLPYVAFGGHSEDTTSTVHSVSVCGSDHVETEQGASWCTARQAWVQRRGVVTDSLQLSSRQLAVPIPVASGMYSKW